MWSKISRELFYLNGKTVMAATIETEPDFRATNLRELFEGQYETTGYLNYDVAPDGRFLMIQEPNGPTPLEINIVLNWFEELKRLVPADGE